MKLYLLFLITAFEIRNVFGSLKDCAIPCGSRKDWVCRPDGDGCFYEFINECHLKIEDCVREEKGMPKLKPGTLTKCSAKQKPICRTMVDKLRKIK